jgi:hypothetical protein
MNITLQWILNFGSAFMLWTMGSKKKWAPIVGLLIQVVWAVYFIATKQYVLLIGTGMYTVVHTRNAILWLRPTS